jgi:hypothetical protein
VSARWPFAEHWITTNRSAIFQRTARTRRPRHQRVMLIVSPMKLKPCHRVQLFGGPPNLRMKVLCQFPGGELFQYGVPKQVLRSTFQRHRATGDRISAKISNSSFCRGVSRYRTARLLRCEHQGTVPRTIKRHQASPPYSLPFTENSCRR